MSCTISVEALRIGYGNTLVLDGLNADIHGGETLAVLGPSGCGKTTLLKAVAGLVAIRSGDIRFNGSSIVPVPTELRNVAMVFQKPLLFPYLPVGENVAFGLKMRNVTASLQQKRVGEALRMLRLEEFAKRKPNELSGGQEQRVALARALVTEPQVLLLDEPFTALDANLRTEMWTLFGDLQRRLQVTTLFVTHDQNEAIHIADRVALMLDGRIEQIGAPAEFYSAPKTAAAARFFGWQMILNMAFRPEAARIVNAAEGHVSGAVERVVHLGSRIRIRVRVTSDEAVECERPWDEPAAQQVQPGQIVGLQIPEASRRTFNRKV